MYILEAHAWDEWPVSAAPRDVPQHRSLADRAAAARAFLSEGGGDAAEAQPTGHFPGQPSGQPPGLGLGLPLFADGEGDPFNAAYASWPFRFWALLPSPPRVALKPMPRRAAYDLGDLERWLENHAE